MMIHRLIYSGQICKFADTFYEYEIRSPAEAILPEILAYIRDVMHHIPLPTREEWLKSEEHENAEYYFRGWYSLRRDAPDLWRYIICKPYSG